MASNAKLLFQIAKELLIFFRHQRMHY